jgi:hypothetical protein
VACRRRSGRGGSVTVAACHRHASNPPRAATCRSPSARRLRCCGPNKRGCVRSPDDWAGRRRRSRVSCAATRPHVAVVWTIGPRPRSGMPSEGRGDRIAKLAANEQLRQYVQDRLAGTVMAPDGRPVPGPDVRWIGRRHGRRQHRSWALSWSPEQIAHRLRVDFPDDESMRVSHEAIYQALYVQGRGALRRELAACLRTGRALRVPRARTRGRGKTFVSPEILISQRPAEVEDRAVPGHWEGRPDPGPGQLRDRDAGRTKHPVHDAAALPRMKGHGGNADPTALRARLMWRVSSSR